MTPALKKLTVFGLAAGVGEMLVEQGSTEQEKWRAQKLWEAGNEAMELCRARVDRSALKRATKKIDQVCEDGNEFDAAEMLSFLLLGLFDLQLYSRNNSGHIDRLIKRTLWFTRLYDPKLDNEDIHAAALKKYERWVK